jgi:hypothetical protein
MKGKKMALYAALCGTVAGAAAIAGGLYAHSVQPVFGIPHFYWVYSDLLSGVHVLVGLGVIMVVAGLLSSKWPSVGAIIVCVAAVLGLVYTYGRGQYRWTPMVYYWWAPWFFAWLAGIFAGFSLYQRVDQLGAQETGAVDRGSAYSQSP